MVEHGLVVEKELGGQGLPFLESVDLQIYPPYPWRP
jgi:hypothetical protein